MRTTLIKGIDDDIKIEVVGNSLFICAIMERGKALNPLTYEAVLVGKDLKKILNDTAVWNAASFDIKDGNRYTVVAFDL